MIRPQLFAIISLLTLSWTTVGSFAQDDDLKPLFNGQDLDGWVRVNTAESTWSIEDEMLICSGKPTGELRTTKMYQNFIMEVEWRHMVPRGNAGIFVWADDITARGVPFHRSIEVQVLENAYGNTKSHTTHGDIFPIHGAKMTPVNGRGGQRAFPTENRSKPSPEWNHYRIECRDGAISLAVNGKVVTRGTDCIPRKGYICIESEGGVVHYRNMKIMELPDTDIAAEHIAQENRDFRVLYNGVDLDDWNVDGKWKSQNWVLAYSGDEPGTLTTKESFGDIGFVFDVRLKEAYRIVGFKIRDASIYIDPEDLDLAKHLLKNWNRFEGELRGNKLTLSVNGTKINDAVEMKTSDTGPIQLSASSPVDFANIYVRELD